MDGVKWANTNPHHNPTNKQRTVDIVEAPDRGPELVGLDPRGGEGGLLARVGLGPLGREDGVDGVRGVAEGGVLDLDLRGVFFWEGWGVCEIERDGGPFRQTDIHTHIGTYV